MDPSVKRTVQKLSTIVFWSAQILAHISGIVLLVLSGVWVTRYFGGFNWGKDPGTFSHHAFFGVLGLVVVCGEAILFIEVPKRFHIPVIVQKAVHATIHTCALIFTIVSLTAAIRRKEIIDGNHLYSPHSWLGLVTVIVFFLQYVIACVMYGVARCVGDWLTDLYQNTHAYTGLFTLALSVGTCLTGFMEKVANDVPNYWTLPPAAVLANICCMLLVLFSACVAYGATRPSVIETTENDAGLEEHCAPDKKETAISMEDAMKTKPSETVTETNENDAGLEEHCAPDKTATDAGIEDAMGTDEKQEAKEEV